MKGFINLETCTKEALKNRIKYYKDNLEGKYYLYLNDKYTDEPTLFVKSASLENKEYNSFAEIEAGQIINGFDNEYRYYDDLESFTDMLYDYIEKNYR